MTDSDGFLDRWSKRKRLGPETPELEPEAAAPESAPVEVEERTDEEILAELGLPHPDALKPGDDVTGFMGDAIPAHLRRIALRQLWRGNPVLANLDGLVEYGEDYTDAATVVENMQTLYQVGKGMFREVAAPDPEEAEMAADAAEAPEPDGAEAEGAEPEGADPDAPEPDGAEDPQVAADAPETAEREIEEPAEAAYAEDPRPEEMAAAPTARRMVFR